MFLKPTDILSYLPLSAGHKVGDFGAGNGAYADALLEKLGREGAVYAFDFFSPHVEAMHRSRVARQRDNLFSLCVDLNSHLPLKDALLHCSLLVNTLHALRERTRFLSELNRVMRPGGRVLMADWAASFNGMGPTNEAAVTPGEAVRLFKATGFRVGDMLPAGTHHYAFIAEKL